MSRPTTLTLMTSILQFSFLIFLILHHFQFNFEATNFSIYITLHIETQINVWFTILGLYDANSTYHLPPTIHEIVPVHRYCSRASHVPPQFVFSRSQGGSGQRSCFWGAWGKSSNPYRILKISCSNILIAFVIITWFSSK
jgi:hypothetical protein